MYQMTQQYEVLLCHLRHRNTSCFALGCYVPLILEKKYRYLDMLSSRP
jgi:hypothetical protein